MRLIDADELINELTGKDPSIFIPPYMKEHCMMMVDILENYPIAYDVDKVVEQLENVKSNHMRIYENGDKDRMALAKTAARVMEIDRAIEIVKDGVEE